MNIDEYEALKEKIKKFEKLSNDKEELKEKIKDLKKYISDGTRIYIDICQSYDSKVHLNANVSKNICDCIIDRLEVEVQNISSEIEKL